MTCHIHHPENRAPHRTKVVVVSNLSYAPGTSQGSASAGYADLADILLLRAVHRINQYHQPDLTVILGPVVDAGNTVEVAAAYQKISKITNLLKRPWIVLPGERDVAPDEFYTHFPRPPAFLEFPEIRLEIPAGQATGSRGPHFAAPISVQHAGGDAWGDCFAALPDMSVTPFSYREMTFSAHGVAVADHSLRLPEDAGLFDFHVHTPFAYCSENMDFAKALRLASAFGLQGLAFSEHTGHLYFARRKYQTGECFMPETPFLAAENRMPAYWQALDAAAAGASGKPLPFLTGLEIDARHDGSPLLLPADAKRAAFRMGAVHSLASIRGGTADSATVKAEFMGVTAGLVDSGIQVLAHPFRVFRKAKREVPRDLFQPLARLLKENGVAAEINFHTNQPDPDFFRICMEEMTPIVLGSDAHNLYEIGEFMPHLSLLAGIGMSSRQLHRPSVEFSGECRESPWDPRNGCSLI